VADDYDQRIRRSLRGARIALDAFNRPDAGHAGFVAGFFSRLLGEGRLVVKETPCLFCEDCDTYLFEAYVGGTCPTCLEGTRGNICEVCGHPNDPVDLIDPRCGVDRDHRLTRKPAPGLFLPLERYRTHFECHYGRTDVVWRTHLMEFVRQMLAKPLPDFRLTYPTRWGIPVDLPGLGGQKFNAWGEMLPGLLNSLALAHREQGEAGEFQYNPPPPDTQLVQFFGYDNSFFFAFVHLGLLFAAGPRCIVPKALISNEFYELENLKFSTSLKHAIWVGDFLERYDADAVRLYLSATNPELQRTNYVEAEMRAWLQAKLLEPWERIRAAKPGAFDEAAAWRRFDAYAARLEQYYGVQFFSLRQSARVLVQALHWLAASGAAPTPAILARLAAFAAPIMPRFAGELARSLGLADVPRWQDREAAAAVMPAALPPIRMEAEAA
jgi:methionyl-tRNA synthetase